MKGWTAHDKQQHAFPLMAKQVEDQHCSLHTWPGEHAYGDCSSPSTDGVCLCVVALVHGLWLHRLYISWLCCGVG